MSLTKIGPEFKYKSVMLNEAVKWITKCWRVIFLNFSFSFRNITRDYLVQKKVHTGCIFFYFHMIIHNFVLCEDGIHFLVFTAVCNVTCFLLACSMKFGVFSYTFFNTRNRRYKPQSYTLILKYWMVIIGSTIQFICVGCILPWRSGSWVWQQYYVMVDLQK